ncbi:MAG TPA: universal stress protein [Polyangia bacterium]|nr:universal stress protein [Polyangia bacterium]
MKRILVGVDGSKQERDVLGAARNLAEKNGAQLILLRVVTIPIELPPRALAVSPDAVGPMLSESAGKHVKELAAELPPSLGADARVALGSPWNAICDTAREENVDLIVIGSHGYGGIDRLIGTTAAKVVNHADCSVLVVRPARG